MQVKKKAAAAIPVIPFGHLSKNDKVLNLIVGECRVVSDPTDESLKADAFKLWEEAAQHVDGHVLDLILSMTRNFRKAIQGERATDHKNPPALIYNVVHNTWSKSQALKKETLELREQLREVVGDYANAIFSVISQTAWSEQNQQDWQSSQGGYLTGAAEGYLIDSQKSWMWARHSSHRMGFDGPPWISKNLAVKAFIIAVCKQWTSIAGHGARHYHHQIDLRRATLKISETELDGIDEKVVQTIREMTEKFRESTHLERSASMNPLSLIQHSGRHSVAPSKAALAEAKRIREQVLQVLLGDEQRAMAVWHVAKNAAWNEQNQVDYDTSAVHSTAVGYLDSIKKDTQELDRYAYRMGFDE